jgi:hypothetical protein
VGQTPDINIHGYTVDNKIIAACHLLVLAKIIFFDPENGGDVPPKRGLQLNRLHGVTSQKMILF